MSSRYLWFKNFRTFFFILSFQHLTEKVSVIKCWLDMNQRPLVSLATALPTSQNIYNLPSSLGQNSWRLLMPDVSEAAEAEVAKNDWTVFGRFCCLNSSSSWQTSQLKTNSSRCRIGARLLSKKWLKITSVSQSWETNNLNFLLKVCCCFVKYNSCCLICM